MRYKRESGALNKSRSKSLTPFELHEAAMSQVTYDLLDDVRGAAWAKLLQQALRGTQLLDETAQMSTSNYLPQLAEVAPSLFSSRQPELPEELSLLREDGEPWLAIIAHEKDAYLVLSFAESTALVESIPTLSLQQV